MSSPRYSTSVIPPFVVGLFQFLARVGVLSLIKGPLRPVLVPLLAGITRLGLLKFSRGTYALFSTLSKPGILGTLKDTPPSDVMRIVHLLAKPGVMVEADKLSAERVIALLGWLLGPGALTELEGQLHLLLGPAA